MFFQLPLKFDKDIGQPKTYSPFFRMYFKTAETHNIYIESDIQAVGHGFDPRPDH